MASHGVTPQEASHDARKALAALAAQAELGPADDVVPGFRAPDAVLLDRLAPACRRSGAGRQDSGGFTPRWVPPPSPSRATVCGYSVSSSSSRCTDGST